MLSNEDQYVLNETYKNSKMGVDAINTLIGKVYNDELSYELNQQANKFREIEKKAEDRLREKGVTPEEDGIMSKAMLWSSIQMNTLMNTSTKHVADMMIQGNAKGVTELLKATHQNKNASKYAMELAEDLMDFEEKNIEKLKSYL